MTRSELIERITLKNPHLTAKDVERVVNVIFDAIITSLTKGDRVEFRGFGTFSVRTRSARKAKNPRTGEQVSVDERKIPHFKCGKHLFEMLNK
ncbi:MAG: integration host factor subunit beta [Alphaproteobacteria bacterium]|nr:integration host factor subunit beta [Alphaproteobacteria bacterium]